MTTNDMLIVVSIVMGYLGLVFAVTKLWASKTTRLRRENSERALLKHIQFIKGVYSSIKTEDAYNIEYFVHTKNRSMWEKLLGLHRLCLFRAIRPHDEYDPEFLSNYSIVVSETECMKLSLQGIVGTKDKAIAQKYIDEMPAHQKKGRELIIP